MANKNFNNEQDSTSNFTLDLRNSLPRYYVRETEQGKNFEVAGSAQIIFKSRFAAAILFPTDTSDLNIKFDQNFLNQTSKL